MNLRINQILRPKITPKQNEIILRKKLGSVKLGSASGPYRIFLNNCFFHRSSSQYGQIAYAHYFYLSNEKESSRTLMAPAPLPLGHGQIAVLAVSVVPMKRIPVLNL